MVQLFQALLHTETVGKLPRFIEAIFNTPSHHRVHHGANKAYLDKNYAGIFIIWDKLFGSFVEETDKVIYGVLPPINSNNPAIIFFHGFTRLGQKIQTTTGIRNKLACLYRGPGWQAEPAKREPLND